MTAIVNLSGDIEAIYNYDAFGKITSMNYTTVSQTNPLRYRGYYFDSETGFYYLKSRYYDPAICRFINADGTENLGINGEFISYNLFAYCLNNPINNSDARGEFVFTTIMLAATISGAIIGGVVGGVFGAINAAASGGDPVAGAISGATTGVITGAITGFAGCVGGGAIVAAAGANALIAGGIDAASQKVAHEKDVKAGKTKAPFKPNYKSILTASSFAVLGTLGGIGLSSAGSVGEAVATACTGGYFAGLASATLEMITRKL